MTTKSLTTISTSRTFFSKPNRRQPLRGLRSTAEFVGFTRNTHDGLVVFVPKADQVNAVFTTRLGGVSTGALKSLNLSATAAQQHSETGREKNMVFEDLFENVSRVNEAMGLRRSSAWRRVRQVHGDHIVEAHKAISVAPEGFRDLDPATEVPEADGIVLVNEPCTILTADCLALLIVGDRCVIVHAGWRGIISGIVSKAVRLAGGAPRIFASPAIGPCCFEVGDDVRIPFASKFGSSTVVEGGNVDLWEAARISASGVGATDFSAIRLCTSCNEDLYFSHRRDKGITGRHGLVALRT